MDKVSINGVDLAYRLTGKPNGRPIMLIHGLTANSGDWDQTANALAGAGWRVLAPDCPGHGGSAAPLDPEAYHCDSVAVVLHALAVELGFAPAVIVGNSMGGAIAEEYALHFAGDVAALVLVDSAGGAPAAKPAGDPRADFVAREMKVAFEQGMAAVWDLHQKEKGPLYAARLPAEAQAARKAHFCQCSPRGYIYGDRAWLAKRNTLPGLAQLNAKTLIVCCERESHMLRVISNDLAAVIPGAKYETIADAWHQPHRENPAAFNATLLGFLKAL